MFGVAKMRPLEGSLFTSLDSDTSPGIHYGKPMMMIPHDREGWLRVVLLPFKTFVVIAPVLLLISENLPRPRHSGSTPAEFLLVFGLLPCGVRLLFAALLLTLVGPKGSAVSCAGFGLVAILLLIMLSPSLAFS